MASECGQRNGFQSVVSPGRSHPKEERSCRLKPCLSFPCHPSSANWFSISGCTPHPAASAGDHPAHRAMEREYGAALPATFCNHDSAIPHRPTAHAPASCLLPPASCLLPPASCLLPHSRKDRRVRNSRSTNTANQIVIYRSSIACATPSILPKPSFP